MDFEKCFASMSLPQICAPIARLQSLRWDPFGDSTFEELDWHSVLSSYGIAPAKQVKNICCFATPNMLCLTCGWPLHFISSGQSWL